MSDLEDYAIKELKDGFTKSGLSTNEWSIKEIIEDRMEVTETTYNKSGDPAPRTPVIRVSPRNCMDQQIMAKLGVDITEKETTTWTLSTELTLSKETELSASGDIAIGEGTATTKSGVSFKIGGSTSNSTENQVSIKYSQDVPVKPKHQTTLELKIFTTPVSGKIKGFRYVRVRYQYDLDVPYQFFDDTHTGTAGIRIPFEVDFTSEIITFVPIVRERAIDCEDRRLGLLLPGDDGYQPEDHPLHGIPATRIPGGGYLASATHPGGQAIVLNKLDAIIEAAEAVNSPEALAETFEWPGDKIALATTLFHFARGTGGCSAEDVISSGEVNPDDIGDIIITDNPDTTSVSALDADDIRNVENIGDKRAALYAEAGITSLSALADLSPGQIEQLEISRTSTRSVLAASQQAQIIKYADMSGNMAEALSALGLSYPFQVGKVNSLLQLPGNALEERLRKTRLPKSLTASDIQATLEGLL